MNLAPKAEEFTTADMAEDPRYRGNDPFARPQGARPQGTGSASVSDPLAELARLIGQNNDAFADLNRDPRVADPRGEDPRVADSRGADTRSAASHHAPRREQPNDAPIDWRTVPKPDPFRNAPPKAPPVHADPFAAYGSAQQPAHSPSAQPAPRAAAPRAPEPQQRNHPDTPASHPVTAPYAAQDYDAAAYGQQPNYDQQSYETDPYYQEDQGEDGIYPAYEDTSAPRRRGGILTVLAVLVLAIVGTAAAFGYRAVFGNSSNTLTPPPVIRADAAPTKVVPATQSGEQPSKQIYDRVGDRSQGEKVVTREEQPVEIRQLAPPSVMFPGPANVAPQGASGSNAASLAPMTSVPPGGTEPKKVRTVTIRADQPNGPSAAPPPSPAPVATRSAVPQFPVAAAVPATPEPAPTAAPTAPAPRTARTQSIPPSANAPLSLSAPNSAPNSAPSAAPMPPAPRVASAPARASAPIESGSYVQVSSQRSEAEAQSSFRSLQTRYPNILGGRQAVIRRADLGDKGTYYRAQVGPFGAADATQLCESLKAAGGQCMVQRN